MNDAQKATVDQTVERWQGVIDSIKQIGRSVDNCLLCQTWRGGEACKVCPGRTPTTILAITKEDVEEQRLRHEDELHDICNLAVDIKAYLAIMQWAIAKAIPELKATKEEPDEVIRNISDG